MKLVYICSPCRGDYERNITKAQEYCREAISMGVIPIAPHVYFTQFLNDLYPEERKLGMTAGLELLKLCSEVWVYGMAHPSEGMTEEIKLARKLGIPVRDAVEVYTSHADPSDPDLGTVTISIPGFEAMAICNEHLNHPPLTIELDAGIILDLAKRIRANPGGCFTIGGGKV